MAMTPTIDGKITADEWDLFVQSEKGEAYLQWEPGRLYVGGRFPQDTELVVSIDTNQNGWLVGKDNLEFRLRVTDGKATMQARQLDATNVAGPKWVNLPAYDKVSVVAGSSEGGEVQVEAAVVDPGIGLLPVKHEERYMVRMDIVPQSAQASEPFYPRIGKLITLKTERASAMPLGLDWKVEDPGRTVMPGRTTKVRFSFSSKSDPDLKKIEIKPIGNLADHASSLGQPFPTFDKKGRTFVDYDAKTGAEAPTGYHLVSTTLFTADGAPALIQASIRVAPLVDFDIPTDKIELEAGVQEIKIPFYVKSNSVNRVDGKVDVAFPSGWEIVKGDVLDFTIYNSRAGMRRVVTVKVPADAQGPVPVRFTAHVGQKNIYKHAWITIVRKSK